jgi:hypothetical protein
MRALVLVQTIRGARPSLTAAAEIHAGVNRVLLLTGVELRQLNARPVAAQSTRVDRPRRLSHRRPISLQVDVVGRRLRAEMHVRRTPLPATATPRCADRPRQRSDASPPSQTARAQGLVDRI